VIDELAIITHNVYQSMLLPVLLLLLQYYTSNSAGNFHVGGYNAEDLGTNITHWGPRANFRWSVGDPEAEALCRHCSQCLLSTKTIKI